MSGGDGGARLVSLNKAATGFCCFYMNSSLPYSHVTMQMHKLYFLRCRPSHEGIPPPPPANPPRPWLAPDCLDAWVRWPPGQATEFSFFLTVSGVHLQAGQHLSALFVAVTSWSGMGDGAGGRGEAGSGGDGVALLGCVAPRGPGAQRAWRLPDVSPGSPAGTWDILSPLPLVMERGRRKGEGRRAGDRERDHLENSGRDVSPRGKPVGHSLSLGRGR